MKKITLLLFIFCSAFAMQAQNLLNNGDFEEGMVEWTGNAFNVQEDGGNSFNFANVETAGNAFDVNLSQILSITEGETYVLTFDASTGAGETRTIIAGIGLNEAPFTAAVETVTLTETLTTFELTLTAGGIGIPNSRVLFDMGAETGVVVIDNVSLVVGEAEEPAAPTVAAPTPPERDAENVFSLFSDAYTTQENTVFGAFGVGTQDIETIQVEGNDTQKITMNQPSSEFLLVDWGAPIDLSSLTFFHMDYWIDTDNSAGLIANPKWSNHVGDAGETSSFQLTNPVTTFGEWVSLDVPLSDFTDGDATQQRDALRQFVLTLAGANTGNRTIYIDNLYLHNETLSTDELTETGLSAFPNPTTNEWVLTTNAPTKEIVVYDVLGKKVMSLESGNTTTRIDASGLTTGIYIANVVTEQRIQSIKLIKQ